MLLRYFIPEQYYDTKAGVREQTGLCGEVDFYHELKTEMKVLKTTFKKGLLSVVLLLFPVKPSKNCKR